MLLHRRAVVAAVAGLVAGAAAAVVQTNARADVAPPPSAPGAALQPGGATAVRLVAERVVLAVEPTAPDGAAAAGDAPVRASSAMFGAVEASFTLRNDGPTAESMAVRFPLWRDADEIAIPGTFQATVDGADVAVERVDGRGAAIAGDGGARGRPEEGWASFPATFPPGVDVAITVRYRVAPTGDGPYGTFGYVLDTGAAWAGAIGAAEVIVRLPYRVTPANTALSPDSAWDTSPLPSGFEVEGNDVVWRFADLEPTASDNIRLTVLAPSVWQAIVDARNAVAAESQQALPSAAVQLAQARALAAGVDTNRDVGVVLIAESAPLAEQALAAFARALELAPDDPDVLAPYAVFAADVESALLYGDLRPVTRTLIERALAAAPDDGRLSSLRDARDGFLRESPTWTAEAVANAAAAAGATAQPTATAAAQPLVAATAPPDGAAAAASSLPVSTLGLGAVALLVVAVLALLPFRRRRGR